jgi:endonuclease-3
VPRHLEINLLSSDFEKTATIIIKNFPKVHQNKDPYFVLVSTILSQRSKDENTEVAAANLFADTWNVHDIASKDPEELYDRIRPSGMFRQKASNIVRSSKILCDKYSGHVPNTLEELTALPGVGRKTADIVLWVSFGIPAMAVDTHVHRISNRLGWINTKTPQESEFALMKLLPEYLWGPLNGAMVEFGKAVCNPRKPKCERCPISDCCGYFKML